MSNDNKVYAHSSDDMIKEQIKVLRTNLTFSRNSTEDNIIMITSSKPDEGKTFISSQLAQSLAESEYKVLVIDADLRKPSIHKYFNVPNNHGLSNVIGGRNELEETIITDDESNLSVLPSGTIPPNPAELLDTKRFEAIINKVKKEYDFVVIDTPPVLPVTDSLIIGTLADQTILVINSQSTSKEDVIEAKQKLDKLNIFIFGVVLNRLKRVHQEQGYYKY
ncbi:CpsD/CapB family tyrosine-protein kinase [Staphylococcus sp. EZ-P03]|uniref:CpsD/CapB family tyrosine-protein kinase n=1 Tax=Staphylococcus sp. EZ-P03 TaxID=2282739 RepID=UPI000DF76CAD|nr:CpsD/CapB family tyrosine-protein kinase [Staphylococcus sp. EZ-P03]